MKITRALLLSSKGQAEAWECPKVGDWFGRPIYRARYRYLVEDRYQGSNLRFSIFRVRQEVDEDGKRLNVVDQEPHVEETHDDMEKLIDYLRRFQIDSDDIWEPVEEEA